MQGLWGTPATVTADQVQAAGPSALSGAQKHLSLSTKTHSILADYANSRPSAVAPNNINVFDAARNELSDLVKVVRQQTLQQQQQQVRGLGIYRCTVWDDFYMIPMSQHHGANVTAVSHDVTVPTPRQVLGRGLMYLMLAVCVMCNVLPWVDADCVRNCM